MTSRHKTTAPKKEQNHRRAAVLAHQLLAKSASGMCIQLLALVNGRERADLLFGVVAAADQGPTLNPTEA